MARTKASIGSKVSAGKSNKARCSVAATPSCSAGPGGSGDSGRGGAGGGGNPVQARETPRWQRPITSFFSPAHAAHAADAARDDEGPASVAATDAVLDQRTSLPSLSGEQSHQLDQSTPLQPLSGEQSHQPDKYYPPISHKGKGIGKTSKGKENYYHSENNNKREREDRTQGRHSAQII